MTSFKQGWRNFVCELVGHRWAPYIAHSWRIECERCGFRWSM